MRARTLSLCGAAVLLLALARAAAPQPAVDASATFGALEARLLNARTVRIAFQVSAEGAVEADLRGQLEITADRHVRLTGAGRFDGKPVDVLLQSEGGEYEFGHRTDRTTAPRPADLEEAVLVGFTRMGVLHNLARLVFSQPPDHAEGGVRAWAVVHSFVADPAATRFDLTVAGEPVGSASLAIDARGRPTVRRQTVKFPSGDMRVVEEYADVTIEP